MVHSEPTTINKRRDVSSGNIGFGCSKWQRLNQEVKKTTKKNKLIKTSHFSGQFDASCYNKSHRCLDVGFITIRTHGECAVRGFKGERSVAGVLLDAVEAASPRLTRFMHRGRPGFAGSVDQSHQTGGNLFLLSVVRVNPPIWFASWN